MNHLETTFLTECPSNFKLHTPHLYVDGTLVSFTEQSQDNLFLNYINNLHPNIKFTMTTESNNRIIFWIF